MGSTIFYNQNKKNEFLEPTFTYNPAVSVPTTDVCMVYFSLDNSTFAAIPLTLNAVEFSFYYQTGIDLELDITSSSPISVVGTSYFNIALIPPAAMKQHPKTNWKDWSQVNAILETQKMNNQ